MGEMDLHERGCKGTRAGLCVCTGQTGGERDRYLQSMSDIPPLQAAQEVWCVQGWGGRRNCEGSRAGLKGCEERARSPAPSSTAASRPPANQRRAELDYAPNAPTSQHSGFISLPRSPCFALPSWKCVRAAPDLSLPPSTRCRAPFECYIAAAVLPTHSRLQNSRRSTCEPLTTASPLEPPQTCLTNSPGMFHSYVSPI